MEIKISAEELRKRRIFVATPAYGGQTAGIYTKSVADLSTLTARYGMDIRYYFLFNESLVTRARNYLVDEFMRSGYTHLLFIDSDIGFDAGDVLSLAALAGDDTDYDIICGPYPKKTISWEKIKYVVDKGIADPPAPPEVLERFVGDYVFNPIMEEGATHVNLDEPLQVAEAGTGFMMIKRKVLEDMIAKHPELLYRPDHARTEHFDGSREISSLFDCIIDPVSRRYLSEDYRFCQLAREDGFKVWLCPWMKLQHMGSYIFGGSMADLIAAGAHPTADVELLKKGRTKTNDGNAGNPKRDEARKQKK